MQSILSALNDHALESPEATAFLVKKGGDWTNITFSALAREVERWAAALLQQGLERGSVVFIVLRHCSDLYASFLGAMRAGLVPSFLPYPTPKQDPRLYWGSHAALFARVEPGCILTYGENIDRMRDAASGGTTVLLDIADLTQSMAGLSLDCLPSLEQVESPDTIALLQHSSGTTGLKKGVALTFDQIRLQLAAYAPAIGADRQDCIVSWLPVYHDMGLVTGILLPVTLGCKVVSIDAFDWLARPDQMLGLIEEHRATLCWLPNFAFNHLVRTRNRGRTYDLSSMHAFINCSEPCKVETFDRFREAFAGHGLPRSALRTCYAMAEAVFAVTQSPLDSEPATIAVDAALLARHDRLVEVSAQHPRAIRFMSCGSSVDGINVRILAEAGHDVGEIQISGTFLFGHYHRNPEDSADAFSAEWYRTGDMGFIRNGELYVSGRIKELLIVHGRNYYAHDIEMVVNGVDGIKPGRAVVFGVHDPATASEEAILLAEVQPGFEGSAADLGKAVRTAVFDHLELSLKKVQILEPGVLVKTTSGKISRKENMKRYLDGNLALLEMA